MVCLFDETFACIRQTFHKIYEAKIKEAIFVGPHITQLFADQYFGTILNSTDKNWPGRNLKTFVETF